MDVEMPLLNKIDEYSAKVYGSVPLLYPTRDSHACHCHSISTSITIAPGWVNVSWNGPNLEFSDLFHFTL